MTTRYQQPQIGAQVDFFGLGKGAASLIKATPSGVKDAVINVGTLVNTTTVTRPKGLALSFNGTSSRYSYGSSLIKACPRGAFFIRFVANAISGNQILVYEGGASFNNFAIILPTSTGGSLTYNINSNTARTSAKTSWVNGQEYTVLVTWGDRFDLYIDGALDSTVAVAGGPTAGNSSTALGCYDISGTYGQYANCYISSAIFFRETKNSVQAKLLHENEWQIFAPQARQIWVPTAGGGATVIPVGVAATPSVGTPTATGQALALPNGVAASSGVGSPVAVAGGAATVNPAGVVATASVGTPAGLGAALGQVSGVGTTASVGVPAAAGEALAAPSGVAASPSVGAPVAIGGTSGAATVVPDGVQAAASIGALIATGAAWCVPGGVVASASVGVPVANGDIPVDADWLPVDDTTWSLQSLRRQWSFDIGAREWRFQMQRRDWPIDKNSP